LKKWNRQLNTLLDNLLENDSVELSIYENDSTDGTDRILERYAAELSQRCKTTFTSTKLGTEHLIGKEGARVKNIAAARNNCLEQAADLNNFDKIVFIETDVIYNPSDVTTLLHHSGDLVSGFTTNAMGDFYDAWATRKTSEETWWNHGIPRKKHLYGQHSMAYACTIPNPLLRVQDLQESIQEQMRFDCDTTVICEVFRQMDYNDIVMLPIEVKHPPNSFKEKLYFYKEKFLRRKKK
jgi:glycosyltransferase involved in cell wall biosynthesis